MCLYSFLDKKMGTMICDTKIAISATNFNLARGFTISTDWKTQYYTTLAVPRFSEMLNPSRIVLRNNLTLRSITMTRNGVTPTQICPIIPLKRRREQQIRLRLFLF